MRRSDTPGPVPNRYPADVLSLSPFLSTPDEVLDTLKDAIHDQELYKSVAESVLWSSRPDQASVSLFWKTYCPEELSAVTPADDEMALPATPLPPDLEHVMLECLEFLERRHRVSYEPDRDDLESESLLRQLTAYVHIAAARAFRVKHSERREKGLSEEAIDCLLKMERAVKWMNSVSGTGLDYVLLPDTADPLTDVSTGVVAALAYAELSSFKRADGDYMEALRYLAEATSLSYRAHVYVEQTGVRSEIHEMVSEHSKQPMLAFDEASGIFQAVRANSLSVENWQQVTSDCRVIADVWEQGIEYSDSGVEAEDAAKWLAFWQQAVGWAESQLSPSELVSALSKAGAKEAENRLKNYFFGDNWVALPSRAQEALILADSIWNSTQGVRRESILNEVRIVIEEMCKEFIWEPLEEDPNTAFEILNVGAKIARRQIRRSPDVHDYIGICRQRYFRDFAEQRGLSDREVRFLVKTLPNAVKQLTPKRRTGEHGTGKAIPLGTIEDHYRTFLGIGRKGVLPEFTRIGRKLRGGRRGRR